MNHLGEVFLVISGILLGRLIYTGLVKPSTAMGKIAGWIFGLILVVFFYVTWAYSGRDPLQHLTCRLLPVSPKCLEPEFAKTRTEPLADSSPAGAGGSGGIPPQTPVSDPSQIPSTVSANESPKIVQSIVIKNNNVGINRCTNWVHEVLPGETLTLIADMHELDPGDLAARNGLDDPDFILAGSMLSLYTTCE